MSTIPFRFEFHEEKPWRVAVYEGTNLIWAKTVFDPPPGPSTSAKAKLKALSLSEEAARLQLLSAIYPRSLGKLTNSAKNNPKPISFEEFKRQSIKERQLHAVDVASLSGDIYAPTNCISEFWTAEHVKLLARALSRPRRKIDELRLKDWLTDNWKPRLATLTRTELMNEANLALETSFKAGKIWQTAYRLGLYTSRAPGPKRSPREGS